MRVILVDDEAIALDLLEHELSRHEDIQVVESYTDPILALKDMETTKPDVIFLDIEMGPVNGLAIAEDFMEKDDSVEIVFITAYSQYAIDAFELNVIDYILKPIQKNRLDKTVKRLRDKIMNNDKVEGIGNLLKVKCLGDLQVTNDYGQTLTWRTQKSKEVFAYLLLQKDRQALKDIILETIFPEREIEKANTLLHTTIYQLRSNLKSLGFKKGISFSNGWYKLSIPIETDIHELDKIIDLKKHSQDDISKIIKIYEGDFLEYEGYHWTLGIRQKYKEVILKILDDFIKDQLDKNQYPPILTEALDLMYRIEPYDEITAKNIIAYYGKQGQVKKVKDFFKQYKAYFKEELNIEPTESTVRLYKKFSQN